MDDKNLTIKEIIESEGWKDFTKKLEIIGAIVSLIGLVTVIINKNIDSVGFLFALGFLTLAINYFYFGFKQYESESRIISLLFYKVYGFGLSIASITALFIIEKWPYPKQEMIILAIILHVISISIGLKERSEGRKDKWLIYFIRPTISIIVLIYLLCY